VPVGAADTATPTVARNENKRLRITGIRVKIALGRAAAEIEHLDRVLSQFEDFCTVSMSVREGIPIAVEVTDNSGAQLKA
jgi:organic hydroperoxide reductase OsmC/OhrA